MSNFIYSEPVFTVLSEIEDFKGGLAPLKVSSLAVLHFCKCIQVLKQATTQSLSSHLGTVTWAPLVATPWPSTARTQFIKHHWTVLATKTFFISPNLRFPHSTFFSLPYRWIHSLYSYRSWTHPQNKPLSPFQSNSCLLDKTHNTCDEVGGYSVLHTNVRVRLQCLKKVSSWLPPSK